MNITSIFDPLLWIPFFGLSAVSLVLIASTSPQLFFSQLLFFLLGIGLFFFTAFLDYRVWRGFTKFLYIISLLLLLVTMFGPIVRGSTRWLEIAGYRFQTSEIVKSFLIIIFANRLSYVERIDLKGFVKHSIALLPILFLIFKQPDLGNVLVYIFIFLVMHIAAGFPFKYLAIGFLGSIILFPFFWHLLAGYQKERLVTFLEPTSDPAGAGYNALQAIIAIGSGQIWGLGLGKGTQSRLLFLPEYHTDFVFASLGEEFGFLGGITVLILYIVLLCKIISVGLQAQDSQGWFIAVGVFTQLFVQVFINIGMNIGLLPITGITLPLISYGGSSIISTMINLGLIISVYMTVRKRPLVIR